MDKHLLENLGYFDATIQRAVFQKEVSGSPFLDFAEDATALFAGFRVISDLLQIDTMRDAIDGEEDRMMNGNQKGALVGLIRASSWIMERRACDIADWAHKRIDAREENATAATKTARGKA